MITLNDDDHDCEYDYDYDYDYDYEYEYEYETSFACKKNDQKKKLSNKRAAPI